VTRRRRHRDPVIVDPAQARVGIVASGTSYLNLRKRIDGIGLDEAELLRRGVRVKKVSPRSRSARRNGASSRPGSKETIVEEKRPLMEPALGSVLKAGSSDLV
jgi:indolepyruvate ferredoxin oxidoreductase